MANAYTNPVLSKPAKRRALAFLSLLLLALSVLSIMIFRNYQHFDTVLSYVSYSHRIQNVSVELQQSLINYLLQENPDSQSLALVDTLAHIDELIADNVYLSADTKTNLEKVRGMLTNLGLQPQPEKKGHLTEALTIMSETLNNETLRRETLLEEINFDTRNELYSTLAIFLPILLGAILFLRFRILLPLNDLRMLLEQLTEGRFSPINTAHLDSLLLPVFTSYNNMVTRLAELEAAQKQYAQSLQREVRLATQALLEQQHSLARAERLAAVGEVAAELAHEIRNPLAGIDMAFSNLRKEITEPQLAERMMSIASELKRLAKLLNDILRQSNHTPESANNFDAIEMIRDLVALVRYQIPEGICMTIEAPSHLPVRLPESGLRQVLLNLVLNAAQVSVNKAGTIILRVVELADEIRISVIDDGPGFSNELLEYGIRPFRTTRSDGTGLGLAMVQRYVKHVGGQVKLSNHSPHGACVTVSLAKNVH